MDRLAREKHRRAGEVAVVHRNHRIGGVETDDDHRVGRRCPVVQTPRDESVESPAGEVGHDVEEDDRQEAQTEAGGHLGGEVGECGLHKVVGVVVVVDERQKLQTAESSDKEQMVSREGGAHFVDRSAIDMHLGCHDSLGMILFQSSMGCCFRPPADCKKRCGVTYSLSTEVESCLNSDAEWSIGEEVKA